MEQPCKIALVGLSGYGAMYLDGLLGRRVPGPYEVVGWVDPYPQLCKRIDELRTAAAPLFRSIEELLDSRPDVNLVVLATPIHLHARHTEQCLAAGADVLCEKPLAGGMKDGRKLVAAAAASDRLVGIGYQWSFSTAVQSLKADIIAGKFGRPLRLRALATYPRAHEYYERNNWAGRIRTVAGDDVFDSPANNATAHHLHNMLYVIGPTRETAAKPKTLRAELYRVNEIENYDTAAMAIGTECGVELMFYTSHATPERRVKSVFEFEDATISIDMQQGSTYIARFKDGTVSQYGDPEKDKYAKLQQSIESWKTRQLPACGPVAAMSQTMVVSAAQHHARVIDVPPSSIEYQPLAGGSMRCVEGLGATLRTAFDNGVMLADTALLPWTVDAKTIDVAAAEANPPRPVAMQA